MSSKPPKNDLPLTPYAELLVRPADDDQDIRHAFHAIARLHHPDRPGAGGVPGSRWAASSAAYALVKTLPLRQAWERSQASLSGRCAKCKGAGVTGWPKVRLCAVCAGAGRKK